jgi:hypothetical protein
MAASGILVVGKQEKEKSATVSSETPRVVNEEAILLIL